MMTVILAGIVSIDFAIRQSGQGTSRGAIVAMRTSAIMAHITKNAQLAKGDIMTPAYVVTPSPTEINIAIRQEVRDTTITPPDTSTHIWVTYTYFFANRTILFCDNSPDETTLCASGINLGMAIPLSAQLFNDPATQQLVLEVTLTNRYDLTVPPDPINNPQMILTSQTSPSSYSQ